MEQVGHKGQFEDDLLPERKVSFQIILLDLLEVVVRHVFLECEERPTPEVRAFDRIADIFLIFSKNTLMSSEVDSCVTAFQILIPLANVP